MPTPILSGCCRRKFAQPGLVRCWLSGLGEELPPLPGPVGITSQGQDLGVMNQAVVRGRFRHRPRQGRSTQQIGKVRETQCDPDRRARLR